MVYQFEMDPKRKRPNPEPTRETTLLRIQELKEERKDVVESNERFKLEKQKFSSNLLEFRKNHEQLQPMRNLVDRQAQEQNAFFIAKLLQNRKELENKLKDQAKLFTDYFAVITKKMKEEYLDLSKIIHYLLDVELFEWKKKQRLAGIGHHLDIGQLDSMQKICEDLVDLISFDLQELKFMKLESKSLVYYIGESRIPTKDFDDLLKKFGDDLTTIITSTFIVEKQPPQVMKTNTRFSTKVRSLIGGKLTVGNNPPPKVMVSIIGEKLANNIVEKNMVREDVHSGEMLNNIGEMEYDKNTSQLSFTFKNMQLKNIKRADKKGSESVIDEKFALVFTSKISVCGEYDIQLWTLSLPVAVIVHGNQESHAWATIIWDNAFAQPGRKLFEVPTEVPWEQLAYALNLKFTANTGRSLSDDNIRHLAEILFGKHCENYDEMLLTWSQFSKVSLPHRNFTFWDWFFAKMKLTTDHLKLLWTENKIMGFIGKSEAEEILGTCSSGTFLLRFSDSVLGGISVAWVDEGPDNQKRVIMIHPFTAKDFAMRILPDRLNDLSQLIYLYPNIAKEIAFGQHYSPRADFQDIATSGYLKPILVTQVLGWKKPSPQSKNLTRLSSSSGDYPKSRISDSGIFQGSQNRKTFQDWSNSTIQRGSPISVMLVGSPNCTPFQGSSNGMTFKSSPNSMNQQGSPNSVVSQGSSNGMTFRSSPNSMNQQGSPNSVVSQGSSNGMTFRSSPNSASFQGSPNSVMFQGSPNSTNQRNSPNSVILQGSPNCTSFQGSSNVMTFKSSPNSIHQRGSPNSEMSQGSSNGMTFRSSPNSSSFHGSSNSINHQGSPNSVMFQGSPNSMDQRGSPNSAMSQISSNGMTFKISPNSTSLQGSPNSVNQQGSPNSVMFQGSPNGMTFKSSPNSVMLQGPPNFMNQQSSPNSMNQRGPPNSTILQDLSNSVMLSPSSNLVMQQASSNSVVQRGPPDSMMCNSNLGFDASSEIDYIDFSTLDNTVDFSNIDTSFADAL